MDKAQAANEFMMWMFMLLEHRMPPQVAANFREAFADDLAAATTPAPAPAGEDEGAQQAADDKPADQPDPAPADQPANESLPAGDTGSDNE